LETSLGKLSPSDAPHLAEPSVKKHIDKIDEIHEQEDMHFIIEDTRELLEDSKEGLERIKKIILGLKEFSHVDGEERKEADLNEVIDNTVNLVWNQIKYSCKLEKELDELPLVSINPGEISQVIANLLINAAQAIESNGIIKIKTQKTTDGQILSVSDNGKGIKPEHIENIFNPFFTTKEVGEGTGLGLSISHNIIQNHGGKLEVQSEEGLGTTFTIFLPNAKT
jgi:signal transduction histidine kinase